jgi:ABC-type oligopeptide transport system substrate-binding subunit
MRATRKHLRTGAAGLSALLLLLAACGKSEQSSDQGASSPAPAAGSQEPAANPPAPAAPAPEQPKQQ